ncbi:MAG TPA: FkbM family methyltransferase [Vicinamibacterales bacterium]|jgi:FkbM family methyltransferase|nr:FkbM family methyltransferase [Vicinamibacterales bacterium]
MSILRYLGLERGLATLPPSAAEDRATEQDIYYAYRLILKRDPDDGGLTHYRQLVSEGLSLDRLIRSFINSDEYRHLEADESRPTPVDLGGYQVCIQKLDTDFGHGIFHSHKYEEHVRRAARENLHAGDVAVDVGANVGVLTFLAAAIVGKTGRVIAVEPNPDNLQMLYRGIVLNGFENVEVLPYAASNRRSVFSLTGGTSNTHVVGAREPEEGGHFVQSIVLDDVLGQLPRLDFVKMDIEGHEPQAFEGFARLIGRYHPALLVEFNPRCLVNLQQQNPLSFLQQIFSFYPSVRVTSAFDDDVSLDTPEKVMAHWDRRNREITAQKRLPDGMLHFDLIARAADTGQ